MSDRKAEERESLDELVEFEGRLLVRSDAEAMHKMKHWGFLSRDGKEPESRLLIEDGHVVEIITEGIDYMHTAHPAAEKLGKLRRIRVMMPYEGEKLRTYWWENEEMILDALKEISMHSLGRGIVALKRDGITFEYLSAAPSDEAVAALLEHAVAEDNYLLWKRLQNKAVPEDNRINESPFGLKCSTHYSAEKVKQAMRKAEKYFHPFKPIDFNGQGLVREEYDVLMNFIQWNSVGALNEVEPRPEDVIIENGHVVELRIDGAGYGDWSARKLKKQFPCLEKINVSMLYDMRECVCLSTSVDGEKSSRKAVPLDIPEDQQWTITTRQDGITFEYTLTVPDDEELRERVFYYVLGKHPFRDKDGNEILPGKFHSSVTALGYYMGNDIKVAAAVSKALATNDISLWRMIRNQIPARQERLNGNIYPKGCLNGEPAIAESEKLIKRAEYHFDYRPKNTELVMEFLEQFKLPESDFIDYARKIMGHADRICLMEGGYGSKGVVDIGEDVAKVGTAEQIEIEALVYELLKQTPTGHSIPELKDYKLNEDIGLMRLANFSQTKDIAEGVRLLDDLLKAPSTKTKHDYIMHNLRLMAQFHADLTSSAKNAGKYEKFKRGKGYNSNSNPDLLLIEDPLENKDLYSYFKGTMPTPETLARALGIAAEVSGIIENQGRCIIQGDWKPENTDMAKKGNIYDFSDAGDVHALEYVRRFVTSYFIRCPMDAARHYAREYMQLRSEIDPEFRESTEKQKMIAHADKFYAFETALYALRANKRDLSVPEKSEERIYYLSNLKNAVALAA